MEKIAYKEAIKYLKNSPVFAMSLSSKELFHSNFWAWLMEQDSKFITCFFDDFEGKDGISISREKEHMDIQIEVGKCKYVIENKFKSIPTESQLCKYSETDGFQKGVLTGISENAPFDLPSKWKYLSYGCICDKLEQLPKGTKSENLSNNKMIVTQYIEMTRNLVRLVGDFLNEYGNKWLFPDKIPEEIRNDLRIGDVIQKMQAERFLHYFCDHSTYRKNLNPESFVENGYTLIARTNMSHATSLLEVLYMKSEDNNGIPKDSKIKEGIGIQIQDGQFRWFVVANKNDSPREVFESYKSIWFDEDFKAGSGSISVPVGKKEPKPTKMGKKGNAYCKFISESSQFIHQYFTPSEDELQFKELVKLIDMFLDAASEVIRAPGR